MIWSQFCCRPACALLKSPTLHTFDRWHLGDTNSWCKMTNFETATRNTLMWHVPGQVPASQGRNERLVEMVDFFPTTVDLLGLPPLDPCEGVDQPPTVQCTQGTSYADEFLPGLVQTNSTPKTHAFSQWAYPVWQSPGASVYRMGYTVRSDDGYRCVAWRVPLPLPRTCRHDRADFCAMWTGTQSTFRMM